MEKEYIDKCPVCHSTNTNGMIEKDGLGFHQCRRCELTFANPRPSPKTMASRLEIWGSQHVSTPQYLQERLNAQADRINSIVRPILSEGKIFDFGCGDGSFVKAAQNAGYDATGLEKSQAAVELIKKNYDVEVLGGDIEDAGLSSNSFDAVTMWDVLEHLPNPAATCHNLVDLLSPGGYLIILTPNSKGISARIQRGNWWVFGPHDHVCMFSGKTLKYFYNDIGVKEHSLKTMDIIPWFTPGYEGKETVMSNLWEKIPKYGSVLKFIQDLNLGDWILTIAKK